ncbi:MAG TPA: hypothetical protein VLK33_14995, partial [Terriglobales bacterium]|nr:hypothetical protein [Terriglobales bacterium]
MKIGVLKETFPGERRVALTPNLVPTLTKAGHEVVVETSAGQSAGFLDAHYVDKGAKIAPRIEVFTAELLLQVRGLGANPIAGRDDLEHLERFQILIALCDPLSQPQLVKDVADRGVTMFSLELMPR